MTAQENMTKGLKFFSQKAIGIATFIGGPLAAGYLVRRNYQELNKPEEGKKAFLFGIVGTIFLVGVILMIPESIHEKIPAQAFPLVYTLAIYLLVEKLHGPILKYHKTRENEFYSVWKAVGIGFLSLIIFFIGMFLFALVFQVGN